MKTAIILTGAMRSFERCLPNLQWIVFRHFPNAKFYIATEDDEDAHKADLLKGATVRKVKQPQMIIPIGCPTTWTQGMPYMHEPYAISVHPSAVMGQLWMLREGWKLFKEANEPAELVIRCRPDLWFHSFEVPPMFVDGKNFFTDGRESIASVPWWGRFGGVNDRFALLGAKAAEHYFTTYDKIPRLISEGAPLHPESLVAASLHDGKASICDDMKAEFSTLRKDGQIRYAEITAIDQWHAMGMKG